MPMTRVLAKHGDVIEIPLSSGEYVYAQYVADGKRIGLVGPLIRVFAPIHQAPIPLSEVDMRTELIPPVFVGLNPPIRSGQWKILGNVPFDDFELPRFRDCNDLTAGKKWDWVIINPDGTREAVGTLPAEYRKLGFIYVHSLYTLDQHLTTGEYAGRDAF